MTPIIFDLDGTLIDVSARHYGLYSEIIAGQGVPALSPEEYWRHRRAGQSTIDLLAATPGVDAEQFTRLWMERIEKPAWLALDALYEGTFEIIEDLRPRYELILITLRRNRAGLVGQLGMLRLAPYFAPVICPGQGAVRGKHLLRGVSGLTPGGFAVGDTEVDIELAAKTGRRAVCLSHGVRSGAYLAGLGAEAVIASLRELPEVLGGEDGSGGPGEVPDVDCVYAPRHVHTRARF